MSITSYLTAVLTSTLGAHSTSAYCVPAESGGQIILDHLNSIADWTLLTALPGIFLFVLFYAINSPWREKFVGRTMMYLAVGLGSLLLVNTASIFLGQNYPGRPFVRIAAYVLLSLTSWRLFLTLRSVQKAPGHVPRDEGFAVKMDGDLEQTAERLEREKDSK